MKYLLTLQIIFLTYSKMHFSKIYIDIDYLFQTNFKVRYDIDIITFSNNLLSIKRELCSHEHYVIFI